MSLGKRMQAYGGMKQYVVWSCQRRGLPVDDKLKTEQFYTDPACQDIYSNMLATMTSRVNTVTGTAYRCASAAAACPPPATVDWLELFDVRDDTVPAGTTPPSWLGRWQTSHAAMVTTPPASCRYSLTYS